MKFFKSFRLSISLTFLRERIRQTISSATGIALGVGFFIAISSMMQGWQQHYIKTIINSAPHIIIKDEYRTEQKQPIKKEFPNIPAEIRSLTVKDNQKGLRNYEQILDYLDTIPKTYAAPTFEGSAFLNFGPFIYNLKVVGILPKQEIKVSKIEEDLIFGSLTNLKTMANGLIIGVGITRKLKLKMGDKVNLTSPKGISLPFKIVGIFDTGITALDNYTSYVTLKKAQILQDNPNTINKVRIRLDDFNHAESTAKLLEKNFSYRTESWKEANINVLNIFNIQNGVMYTTVIAILLVAGFGIFNIISTIVHEKEKDIAILKSIGLSPKDIQLIFIYQGVILGIIGTIFGWLLAQFLLYLLSTVKFTIKDQAFMRLDGFILHRTYWHYIISGCLSLIAATMAAFFPSKKASQLNPVDIIRGAS